MTYLPTPRHNDDIRVSRNLLLNTARFTNVIQMILNNKTS